MPGLSRLRTWAEQAEDDTEEQLDQIHIQMLQIHDQLERFQSGEGWRDLLEEEQRRAFTDMMNGEGDHMVLARERGKLIARLLKRPDDLEKDLDRLRQEKSALEA